MSGSPGRHTGDPADLGTFPTARRDVSKLTILCATKIECLAPAMLSAT